MVVGGERVEEDEDEEDEDEDEDKGEIVFSFLCILLARNRKSFSLSFCISPSV